MERKTPKDEQGPFPFAGMDPATREAFLRYCDAEEQKVRAERLRLETEAREREQAWEAGEPQRAIEKARAEAEALRIQDAAMLESAKSDLEVRKLRIEGQRLEAEAQIALAAKVVDLAWPKLAALGSGIAAEAKQDRELIREELRLIAGRNPVNGEK